MGCKHSDVVELGQQSLFMVRQLQGCTHGMELNLHKLVDMDKKHVGQSCVGLFSAGFN
jgi:hypothetical protein